VKTEKMIGGCVDIFYNLFKEALSLFAET